MKKEKVLFHNTTPTMLTYLKADIREYTINNGFYPDFIDMPEDIYKEFKAKFIGEIENLKLYGIPIRKV